MTQAWLRDWDCAFASRPGVDHEVNEDSVLVDEDLGLLAVADGTGGGRDGAEASRLAMDRLLETVKDTLDCNTAATQDTWTEVLMRGFVSANAGLHDTHVSPEMGMSSTLTAVLVRSPSWHLAHSGDSRAYIVSDGQAEQLTEDHTFVAEMVRAGVLTEAEAKSHPKRGLLSASLGPFAKPKVQMRSGTFPAHAILLLCSDGISAVLSTDEIVRCLSGKGCARAHVERLMTMATDHEAQDDLTAIVCRWHDGQA